LLKGLRWWWECKDKFSNSKFTKAEYFSKLIILVCGLIKISANSWIGVEGKIEVSDHFNKVGEDEGLRDLVKSDFFLTGWR
jgi:hypothetical protein